MVSRIKTIKVFPYQYKLSGTSNTPQNLFDIFKKQNAKNNIISGYYYRMLLIVDQIRNNFVFGKFLKLREDAPRVINLINGTLKDIKLLKDEDIIEISHFILNTEDNLLFGEYNFNAMRHFCYPLRIYLNEKFDVDDNEIVPISDLDTIKKLEKDDKIKEFTIKIANYRPKVLEKHLGQYPLEVLKKLGRDERATARITVSRGHSREEFLDKDAAISLAKELKEHEDLPIEDLKIEAEHSTYDLLFNNTLVYFLNVKKNGRNIDSDDFYDKTIELYKNKAPLLKDGLEEL